jgi:hypothetical protein
MAEGQCEHLVHELTLLSLRGSELCVTIIGAPSMAPLHESSGSEVATWLSVRWAAVSLAAQSILGCLPIDASPTGVVGEMVVKFQEGAEWCSHLETSGSEVYDLALGLVDGRAHPIALLEEVAGRLRAMRDEHEALQSLPIRVCSPVPGRSDGMPPLAVALFPSLELTEGRINAAAFNGVRWGD